MQNRDNQTPRPQDAARDRLKAKEKEHKDRDEALDAALDDSFPASDPPSITSHTPSNADRKPH